MRRTARTGVMTALVAALVVGTAGTTAATAATPAVVPVPAVRSPMPDAPMCREALAKIEQYRNSSALVNDHRLVILGESTPIDLATIDPYHSPFTDPSKTMWFRALTWLAVASVDAAEKGDTATAERYAAALIAAGHRAPDPGSANPVNEKYAMNLGWDAGTTIRRTQALLCLSHYTGVKRLRGLLRENAAALVDPQRYGGPPRRPVANGGIMANLTLIDVGVALGRQDLVNLALRRLADDQPAVFSRGGWSFEGSTHYQSVNIRMWEDAEAVLRQRGRTAAADRIAADLTHARAAAAAVIGPTGLPALIGDTRANDVVVRPDTTGLPLTFLDRAGGLATGRWSWTNRATTWWTAQNRLLRGAHGHADNLAVTWQTRTLPILVDSGQRDYDRVSSPLTIWALGRTAQNRPVLGNKTRDLAKVRTMDVTRTGRLDDLSMSTTDMGAEQRRRALIDAKRSALEVTDTSRRRQTQYWQLAPGWQVTDSADHHIELTHTTGARLIVDSPEGKIQVLNGSLDPLGGWIAVGLYKVIAAPQLAIKSGRSMTTTFVLARGSKDQPGAPTIDRSASRTSSRSVKLAWKAPADTSGIKGYRIQSAVPGQGWETLVVDTKSTDTAITLKRLSDNAKRRFRVAVLTKRSMSPYSEAERAVPPRAEPSQ
ncbi:MAG: fibronectin type III domain-containing protein [Candidatus Nanopelagicales bacterium]